MPNTTDENATTWRDLADQLTSDQVDALDKAERKFTAGNIADEPQAVAALLDGARNYSQGNLASAAFSDVPVPAGATCGGWERNLIDGGWSRSLEWARLSDEVFVDGRQDSDGTFTSVVSVYANEVETGLTAADARKLATQLITAADELDQLGNQTN